MSSHSTSMQWQNLPARVLADDTQPWAAQWDRLNGQGLDLPFMDTPTWTAALRVFGSGHERLLIGTLAGSNEAAAMLIVQRQGPLRWITFQPSQMPLGPVVARSGLNLTAVVESAVARALGPALCLSVTQLDSLQFGIDLDSARSRCDPYIQTAWLDLNPEGFDAYWGARGKNLRQNLKKQRNRLASEDTALAMRLLSTAADVQEALGRFAAMESAGWKAQGGTAITTENLQGRFYERVMSNAANRGEALMTEYLFNGQVVAANMGLLRGGTWVVLKTTYDESIPKNLSPAFLLREDELKHFHGTAQVKRIEYYGRVMEWHTRLTEQQRGLVHLTSWRWIWLRNTADRRRVTENSGSHAQESESVGNAPPQVQS